MSHEIGAKAEEAACGFLRALGFSILARNYAIRGAEVDIIAKEGDFIVFVEVKYRKSAFLSAPRESVTLAKQKRVGRAALSWLMRNSLPDVPVRFDVVEALPEGLSLLRGAFSYHE